MGVQASLAPWISCSFDDLDGRVEFVLHLLSYRLPRCLEMLLHRLLLTVPEPLLLLGQCLLKVEKFISASLMVLSPLS
jgi:hypothetical protein